MRIRITADSERLHWSYIHNTYKTVLWSKGPKMRIRLEIFRILTSAIQETKYLPIYDRPLYIEGLRIGNQYDVIHNIFMSLNHGSLENLNGPLLVYTQYTIPDTQVELVPPTPAELPAAIADASGKIANLQKQKFRQWTVIFFCLFSIFIYLFICSSLSSVSLFIINLFHIPS